MNEFDAESLYHELGKKKYRTEECHLKGMGLYIQIGDANVKISGMKFNPNGGAMIFQVASATEADFVNQERKV